MPSNLLMWVAANAAEHPDMLPIPSGNGLNYFEILKERCRTSQGPVILAYDRTFLTPAQIEAVEKLALTPGFEKLFCVDYNEFRASCEKAPKDYEEEVTSKIQSSQSCIQRKSVSPPRSSVHYLVDLERLHFLARSDVLHGCLSAKYQGNNAKYKFLKEHNDNCLAYTDFDIELKKPIKVTLGRDDFFCSITKPGTSPENSLIIVKGNNNNVIITALCLMALDEYKCREISVQPDYPYGSYTAAFRAVYPSKDESGTGVRNNVRKLYGFTPSIPTEAEFTSCAALRGKIFEHGQDYYSDGNHLTWQDEGKSRIQYTIKATEIMKADKQETKSLVTDNLKKNTSFLTWAETRRHGYNGIYNKAILPMTR
jgi:hypothetical protein